MRFLIPNPKEDRSWTRAYWKALDGYCRKCEKVLLPAFQRSHVELMVFGSTAQNPHTSADAPSQTVARLRRAPSRPSDS